MGQLPKASHSRSDCGRDLIYIMSPSYSGSTLLTFLLAMHPKIATIGELKASSMGDVDSYVCSCGEKLIACEFWRHVIEKMEARGHSFCLDDFGTRFKPGGGLSNRLVSALVRGPVFESARSLGLQLVPSSKASLRNTLAQNKALTEIISEYFDAEFFLDGSKDPVRLKHFHESNLWNVKVIYLIRDGRGVACSQMKHEGVSMNAAAQEWVNKCDEIQHVVRALPSSNVFTLCYETLCENKDVVLNELYSFLGLDYGQVNESFNSEACHILGNSMRLKFSSTLRLDEKWKSNLSKEDLAVFDGVAGKTNKDLGYSR